MFVGLIQTALNAIRYSHFPQMLVSEFFFVVFCFFLFSSIHFEPVCLSVDEVREHKGNRHVIVYVWINFALCACLSGMHLGPLLVFCVSAPDWAWQLCTISCYRTQLHKERRGKHQMPWLNSPSVRANLSTVIPLMPCETLISQWADLISQMLVLQVSSPSWEDCQRHKAREVGLGNQCKRLNGLYAVMLTHSMQSGASTYYIEMTSIQI